jgi:hypothetical protein
MRKIKMAASKLMRILFGHPMLDPHMQFIVDQNRKVREELSRWYFSDEIEEDARWW